MGAAWRVDVNASPGAYAVGPTYAQAEWLTEPCGRT